MFRFKCFPDGGKPFVVDVLSRAITAWENAPGQPKDKPRRNISYLKDMSMADMQDLAWHQAVRDDATDLDIKQWRDQVDVVGKEYTDDDDDEAGPTPETP